MSIVERLFPAAELEALRGSIEGFTDEQPRKRRKTEVTAPIRNNSISSSDSGYNSASSDAGSPTTTTSPLLQPRPIHGRSSSLASSNPVSQSELLQRYLKSMHPTDKARYYAYQRALLGARSRSSGQIAHDLSAFQLSGGLSQTLLPSQEAGMTPRFSAHQSTGLGWTAGPRAASTEKISNRVFDGARLTNHERSMLESLLPRPAAHRVDEESAAPKIYGGIAISHYDDEDEEEEYDDDTESKIGEVEDFFKIEEACEEGSTPD